METNPGNVHGREMYMRKYRTIQFSYPEQESNLLPPHTGIVGQFLFVLFYTR